MENKMWQNDAYDYQRINGERDDMPLNEKAIGIL